MHLNDLLDVRQKIALKLLIALFNSGADFSDVPAETVVGGCLRTTDEFIEQAEVECCYRKDKPKNG